MTAHRAHEASLRPDGLEWKRLIWAFGLSAVLHLAVWGTYSVGKHFQVWERLQMPEWMRKITQVFNKPRPPEEMQPTMPVVPLIFVDVSPSQATAEKPKETPFYSDKNAQAANKEADKDTNTPNLTGEQEKMLKTRDVAKNQFDKLMPALPSPRGAPVDEAKARPTLEPGDLLLGKPDLKKPQPDDGKAEKSRPRTLQEARTRQPELAGQQMRQKGGVPRIRLEASVDTQGTPLGNYDAVFIQAVQDRWYSLLDQQSAPMRSGKVVVYFSLNHDGRITGVRVLENTTESDLLALLCQKGIVDPAPYKEWPREMRLLVGKDSREIKFTFYYN